MANDPNSIKLDGTYWRSRTQSLEWICLRGKTAVLTPEMIQEAEKELNKAIANELAKADRAAARGEPMPLGVLAAMASMEVEDPFRIAGLRPRDIVALIRNGRLVPEDIRWHAFEGNLAWLKQVWPAPTFITDTSMPAANTELSVVKPEPAAPVGPEPTPPTELPHVEPAPLSPKPQAQEPPPEQAEQQRPLLLLPDEPQLEEPRKWWPEEAQAWLKNARQIHPRKSKESKNAYAHRLYNEHMTNDFGKDIPWTEATLRRRLNDTPSRE